MDEATNQMINDGEYDETAFTDPVDDDAYTEQLEADIEGTRTEMSQTIDQIQERLSPEHLMGQVKQTVRDATLGKVEKAMGMVSDKISGVAEPAREVMDLAGSAIKETGSSVADVVWKNPIPLALIGLGVGLLCFKSWSRNGGTQVSSRNALPNSPNREFRSGGRMNSLNEGQGFVTKTVNQVKQTASAMANQSTDVMNNLGSQAKETASAVSSRFGDLMRQNPLALGAVAVAAGTAVGLALPSTNIEREYVGEASQTLVDKAEEVARGALDKVQNLAKESGTDAQQDGASV